MTKAISLEDAALAELGALDHLVGSDAELEHRLLERPWGVQHVVLAGPAEAPPVLLVHGWPQHWLAWRHVIRRLRTSARVVCVDLRGFGWSDARAIPHPRSVVDEHVADLAQTLDDLDIAEATIVGHDWGGWIAFRFMEAHPELTRGGAGLAIMPPWLDVRPLARHLPSWSYVFPMAAAGNRVAARPAWVRAMVEHTTSVPTTWTTPDGRAAMASYQERIARAAAREMTRTLYAGFVGWELRRALAGRQSLLATEATVLLGEHETISRPDQWWRRTRAGELRLRTLDGVGHWIAEEDPDGAAAVLEEVLSR